VKVEGHVESSNMCPRIEALVKTAMVNPEGPQTVGEVVKRDREVRKERM